MKTIFRNTAIAAALLLTFAATSFKAQAQDEKLVYSKNQQAAIGITVDNATGAVYTVRDAQGNIVLRGVVKNDKTFFIATGKLAKGAYRFYIGNYAAQEFIIK